MLARSARQPALGRSKIAAVSRAELVARAELVWVDDPVQLGAHADRQVLDPPEAPQDSGRDSTGSASAQWVRLPATGRRHARRAAAAGHAGWRSRATGCAHRQQRRGEEIAIGSMWNAASSASRSVCGDGVGPGMVEWPAWTSQCAQSCASTGGMG